MARIYSDRSGDTDDDDDYDPSKLYGTFKWKIDKFSQITRRELRSDVFDIGGYKWCILIYPIGCDVCNYMSLFLCVADLDTLYPGWSHFAQFTIAVVNKDHKKSKYSDTLHRFWRKEHDWGWKKFMERSKVSDGFVDADTLIINCQVQVIRERADRPFRCLGLEYKRELLRVYLSNVEQIFCRFGEEKRGRLGKLIEDEDRWSSLRNFWFGIDQESKHSLSRVKSDFILKGLVKHFFVENEVTSTLMMEFLDSGLKALKGQTKSSKVKGTCDAEQLPIIPLVKMESDMFVLVDDVLPLLKRAALEPLLLKDEKSLRKCTKGDCSWDYYMKDYFENVEKRLAEFGRRTIELTVLAYTSSKIELAALEVFALKRQEDLIREEEIEKAKAARKAKAKPF